MSSALRVGLLASAGALAVATALLGSLPASAASETYTLDSAHTFPQFEISHLGFSRHRGRFNQTRGDLVLDRIARSGRIAVEIDAASIDTGDEKLEAILRGERFFDVERHPQLRFNADRFYFVDDQLIAIDGIFSLLGVSRPLRLDVDHFHCGVQLIGLRSVCGANASARFKRSDFGMDAYIGFGLGDEVLLSIQVEAARRTDAPGAGDVGR